MKSLLWIAAVLEGVTGVALFFSPSVIALWMFGLGASTGAAALGRVAAVALIGLAVACWPPRESPLDTTSPWRMFSYSLLVALFLAYQGATHSAGALLWPAVALHSAFLILFMAARSRKGHHIVA